MFSQPSYLASQISKYGRRLLEEALAEHDLRLIDHGVLSALRDFGARSQRELAESLDFDKSDLVGRIDRLERRGIVSRTRDPADRRRNQVALTRSGRALMARLDPIAQRSEDGLLDALTEAERTTLIELLQRVLSANDHARGL